MPNNQSGPELDRCIVAAIDEACEVLGDELFKSAFYYQVARRGIRREEIPQKLEAFQNVVSELLDGGNRDFERLMAKRLYGKLRLAFEKIDDWDFVDYVDEARIKFQKHETRVN